MKKKMTRDIPLPSSDGLFEGIHGKKLSKSIYDTPKPKITGEKLNAVNKAAEMNKKRQAEAAAAPKPMTKTQKIATAVGGALVTAGMAGYEMYHDAIRKDYVRSNKPYGDTPSRSELRKWKKSR